jgi:hypothetical protein
MSDFVPKSEKTEVEAKLRSVSEHNRRLTEENQMLKGEALAEAERAVHARLLKRFSRAFPEYGDGYEGLTEVELPDGNGKVQLNVSSEEPGVIHLRVWGPPSENPYPSEEGKLVEDFRASFELAPRGVVVQSLDFRRRYR